MVERFPQILASEVKATTMVTHICVQSELSSISGQNL